MKKNITTLNRIVPLILLLFTAWTAAHAANNDDEGKDVIYIYRTDGEVDIYFVNDVDEIRYSNIDLQGNIHPQNVLQEVVMADDVYPTMVADIVSMEFTHLGSQPMPASGGSITLNVHTKAPITTIFYRNCDAELITDGSGSDSSQGGDDDTPDDGTDSGKKTKGIARLMVDFQTNTDVYGLTGEVYITDSTGEEHTIKIHQSGTGVFDYNRAGINYTINAICDCYDTGNGESNDLPQRWTEYRQIVNGLVSVSDVPITLTRQGEVITITGVQNTKNTIQDNQDQEDADTYETEWEQVDVQLSIIIDVSESPGRMLGGRLSTSFRRYYHWWSASLDADKWYDQQEEATFTIYGGEKRGSGSYGANNEQMELGAYHYKETNYRYDELYVNPGKTYIQTTDVLHLATDENGNTLDQGVSFYLWKDSE